MSKQIAAEIRKLAAVDPKKVDVQRLTQKLSKAMQQVLQKHMTAEAVHEAVATLSPQDLAEMNWLLDAWHKDDGGRVETWRVNFPVHAVLRPSKADVAKAIRSLKHG